jgi:iron complex transport system substrate-binding protein
VRRGWRRLLLAALPVMLGAASPPAIADLWFAHNAVTTMLGAADRIRVTVVSPAAQPWLFRVAPALGKARIVANGSANAETLLTDGVSVAFTSGEPEAARLRRFGLDARAMGFTDVAGFDRSLRETAGVIGTPLARARLAAYERYTGTVVDRLRGKFGALPEARRPRVLHLVSWSPMKADGANTMIDQWIRLAGGRNAAVGLTGNQQPVSIEQVAAWHPDIIIVGGMAKGPDDRPWAAEPALKGIRIVRNPVGVFPWDRYGPEFALQLQWAAALMHPEAMGHPDLTAETRRFYREFYGYPLSAGDAARILRALPPAG